MKLDFIQLDKLAISTNNMRHRRKAPDVSDLLPTIRARGILQPILVRPSGEEGHYEIVAGARRFTAACLIAQERRDAGDPCPEPMPCAILGQSDDAAAVEASMIENMARRDADEVSQWESFTRLVREGRSIDEIGATFGLPHLMVKRVLALGNLMPRIRAMYRKGEIDRVAVRHLTLASKKQQKAWLALADDPGAHCPVGHQLKAWLLGGTSIPVGYALFDVAASGLVVLADLFGEERFFADARAFWVAQMAEVERRRTAFLDAGWREAVIVPRTDRFAPWEHVKVTKNKGGRVYIDVHPTGEIVVHEGYLPRKEAARLAVAAGSHDATESPPKITRPELSSAARTYIDLHRHAAVRASLTDHPGTALRLLIAHAICGSPHFRLTPEPQTSRHEATAESLATSPAQAAFDVRRRAVIALLDLPTEAPNVIGAACDRRGEQALVPVFHRLLELSDAVLLDIVAVVMGETLACGSVAVEAVGTEIDVDMTRWWRADEAFFALVRDRQVITALLAEVAGETVASANAGEKGKTVKAIIRDYLDGKDGRPSCENWVPRWMRFPPAAYTDRGSVCTVAAHAAMAATRLPAVPPHYPDASDTAVPDKTSTPPDPDPVAMPQSAA